MAPDLPTQSIEKLCRKYQVKELALFGSALKEGTAGGRDVDLLVTFQPGARIGFEFVRLQRELSEAIGRPVDLVPKETLKPLIRDEILRQAVTVYEARETVPG
ncbi:MAG: nucleotidyltransferase [Acidimicrobiia bacterium]|nr:nucleotidyltransferase [Acidimicrobiia bacterium]